MIIELKKLSLNDICFAEYIRVKCPYKWQVTLENEACFVYWINGQNRLYYRHQQIMSCENEALLLKCGNYIDEVFVKNESEVEAVIIHFYPEMIMQLFRNEFTTSLMQIDHPRRSLPARLHQQNLLEKYIDSLLFYFNHPEMADQDILALKIKELLLLLRKTQLRCTLEEMFRSLFSPQELSFKDIIESNIYSGLSLKEIAFLSCRSMATFKRDFRKYFNDSPSRYIMKMKLERAATLISTTDMRIGEIAQDCGFHSLSGFNRRFHQQYHQSPSSYRLSQFTNTMS